MDSHLFSFFPEDQSALADHVPPPMDQYRRIQLARHIIDSQTQTADKFSFDETGRILDFGLSAARLDAIISSGRPFQTSGCVGRDGQVACNRPFGNSRPCPDMRNYPFPHNEKDILRIRRQMETSN